jgi:hypothetical protein
LSKLKALAGLDRSILVISWNLLSPGARYHDLSRHLRA